MFKRFAADLRIIAAIAAKDIVDALKNRITLSIILGVAIMMVSSMTLSLVLGQPKVPSAVVHDAARSALFRGLARRTEFRLTLAASLSEMEAAVGASLGLVLGIEVPPEFHEAVAGDAPVTLDGYAPHWAKPEQVAPLVAFFEEELSAASGRALRISADNRVYFAADATWPSTLGLNLTLQVLFIGLAVVPYLMIEEKETRTYEALLVSPARVGHIVSGKALVGCFYCLCAAAVAFLTIQRWIAHWELAVLAGLLCSAFAVAVGLWMGALFENPATLNMWMLVALACLLGPALLLRFGAARLPALVQAILPCMPSVAAVRLMGQAMAAPAPATTLLQPVAVLAGWALLFGALVTLEVRRMER